MFALNHHIQLGPNHPPLWPPLEKWLGRFLSNPSLMTKYATKDCVTPIFQPLQNVANHQLKCFLPKFCFKTWLARLNLTTSLHQHLTKNLDRFWRNWTSKTKKIWCKEGPKKERTVTKQNICTSVPLPLLCLLLKLQIGKPVKQFNHGDTHLPKISQINERKEGKKILMIYFSARISWAKLALSIISLSLAGPTAWGLSA